MTLRPSPGRSHHRLQSLDFSVICRWDRKMYRGSGKRMRRSGMASKSVKLQSPHEGHRVQSLLRFQDVTASILSTFLSTSG